MGRALSWRHVCYRYHLDHSRFYLALRGRRRHLPGAGRGNGLSAQRRTHLRLSQTALAFLCPDYDSGRRNHRGWYLVFRQLGQPGRSGITDSKLHASLGRRVSIFRSRASHSICLLLHVGSNLSQAASVLARLYMVFSIFTLVIINGILTFMLHTGQMAPQPLLAGRCFNPTYWPSLAIRLLIMMAIAGMYALVTSSRIKDPKFRMFMVRYCATWLLPVFLLGPLCTLWFLSQIPHAAMTTIFTGIQTSGVGNFSVLAALFISVWSFGNGFVLRLFRRIKPKAFTFRIAILFMICGLAVTGTTEWMREMLRKPYVVHGYIYSNGIHKSDIDQIAKKDSSTEGNGLTPWQTRPPPTRKGVNWSFVANACPAIQYAGTEACKQCSGQETKKRSPTCYKCSRRKIRRKTITQASCHHLPPIRKR